MLWHPHAFIYWVIWNDISKLNFYFLYISDNLTIDIADMEHKVGIVFDHFCENDILVF